MKTDSDTRERLRQDLPIIRGVAGWSSERLSELLDVSRATVVTLENTPGKMTVLQYLAVRALLSAEVSENGNELLGKIVSILVDQEDVPEEKRDRIRQQAAQAAKKVGRKAGSTAVQLETIKSIGELKLSEIPPEDIQRGMKIVEGLLSRKVKIKSAPNRQEDKNGHDQN